MSRLLDDGFLPDAHQSPPARRGCSVLPFLVVLFLASLAPAPSGALNDPVLPPAVHSVSRGAPADPAVAQLVERQPSLADGVGVAGSIPARGAHAVAPLPRLAAALPSAGAPASVPATEHGEVGTALVGGYATWYETPGYTAAAGPLLREMLGADWRGSVVIVEGPGRLSVRVALTDACACGERHGLPTLLDLSRTAFAELADPSTGIVAVSIEIPAQLPSTDTRP